MVEIDEKTNITMNKTRKLHAYGIIFALCGAIWYKLPNNYKKIRSGRGSCETGSFNMTVKNKVKGLFYGAAALGASTLAFAAPTQAEAQFQAAAHQIEYPEYSRGEAYKESTDRIVFHYGADIRHVDILAEMLRERGYPAFALPGADDGKLTLIVDRSKLFEYTQDSLLGGDLMIHAMGLYKARVENSNTIAALTNN